MIHTSYFAKYRGNAGCSIAIKHPQGFKGYKCDALFPPKSLLVWYKTWEEKYKEDFEATGDHKKFRENMKLLKKNYADQYRQEVLNKIDVHSVGKALDGKVLLCWERSGAFCHRHLVAEWLRAAGYDCEELVYAQDLKGTSTRKRRKAK